MKDKKTNAALRKRPVQPEVRLAKCPCCGGNADIESCEVGPVMMMEDNAYKVECVECGLKLFAYEKETVIEGWNARYSEDYWKSRCLAAEKYISESPCDPDCFPKQWSAYVDWQQKVKDEVKP